MRREVVLDLCGGTGSWSAPYREAGYDVRLITLPENDVRLWRFDGALRVHGILAAPPCTYFSRMRMCRGEPSPAQFMEGMAVVDACLRIILLTKPSWWALENPQGYLKRWLGPPRLRFHPNEYGDPWTKRTWIWGNFRLPMFDVAPVAAAGPLVNSRTGHPLGKKGIARNFTERATTPPGFARAFYAANNVGDATPQEPSAPQGEPRTP